MPIRRLLILAVIICSIVGSAAAQDTILSLQSDTTQMQTGQEYTVQIRLDNVTSLWLASVEISYDPSRLYIIGTRAGSPVRPGNWFQLDSSVAIFNAVETTAIRYTISQLAPADLLTGGGVLGTFRIYPLAPGPTSLAFRRAELRTATISGEGANRTAGDPQPVPFLPAKLDLTISGPAVEPPSEATATPAPTETPTGFTGQGQINPPQKPTLVNVTLDPNRTGEIETTPAPAGDTTPLMAAALAVMLIGALGLLTVAALWLRTRRR